MNIAVVTNFLSFVLSLLMPIRVARTLHGNRRLFLRIGAKPMDFVGEIEDASTKLGVVLRTLGAMHFFKMFIFDRMCRKTRRNTPTR